MGRKAADAGLLAPAEHRRLASILSRLASPFEGERATAALLASAFVARHDLQWADLDMFLRPVPEGVTEPSAPPQTDRRRSGNRSTWRGYCRRRRGNRGQKLDILS